MLWREIPENFMHKDGSKGKYFTLLKKFNMYSVDAYRIIYKNFVANFLLTVFQGSTICIRILRGQAEVKIRSFKS